VGVFGTLGLLAVLTIATFLVPYIQVIATITTKDLSLLDSSLTILLISITGAYVILTHNISEETKNANKQSKINRDIAYNEKKLEKLYFPLKDILEYFIYVYHNYGYEVEAHAIPDEEWPEVKRNDQYISFIKPILSYQHLAEDNIKKDLDDFFKMINGQKVYTERGLLQSAVELNKKVIKDISSLQNKLDKLHGIEK
jgi:hypothetical protein